MKAVKIATRLLIVQNIVILLITSYIVSEIFLSLDIPFFLFWVVLFALIADLFGFATLATGLAFQDILDQSNRTPLLRTSAGIYGWVVCRAVVQTRGSLGALTFFGGPSFNSTETIILAFIGSICLVFSGLNSFDEHFRNYTVVNFLSFSILMSFLVVQEDLLIIFLFIPVKLFVIPILGIVAFRSIHNSIWLYTETGKHSVELYPEVELPN
jgi:hypothetical protein